MESWEIRDKFALAAMQGILSSWEAQRHICHTDPRYKQQPDGHYNFADVVAINAYEFADAMMRQRKGSA